MTASEELAVGSYTYYAYDPDGRETAVTDATTCTDDDNLWSPMVTEVEVIDASGIMQFGVDCDG